MSYQALVTRVKTQRHPNADRLQLGTVSTGETVVVGLDTQDGELGIYFPPGGQLSEAYCNQNDLIGVWKGGKRVSGGYLAESRRVRAQTFRGVRSDGLWMPAKSLAAFGTAHPDFWQEGVEFTTYCGQPICRRYLTPAAQRARRPRVRSWRQRLAAWLDFPSCYEVALPEHFDTTVYKGAVPFGAGRVIITEKLHGTSHRVGFVCVGHPLSWWQWIAWHMRLRVQRKTTYEIVHGTRRTLLWPTVRVQERFRLAAKGMEQIHARTLYSDEVLYGEIVGYAGQLPVMADHPVNNTGISPNHQGWLRYHYGCEPGACAFYVYRIVQGQRELPWAEVEMRCKELGVPTVPVLAAEDTPRPGEFIQRYIERRTFGDSLLAPSIPKEGVVVRLETNSGTFFWKKKAWAFGVMEGYLKDDDAFVDREEDDALQFTE